jgi:transcription elongation factor GreA
VVTLGAIVGLKSAEGDHMEVQVVSPAEASVLEQPMKISDESPLGRALLGQATGAKVLLETPKGKKEFEIEFIRH